METIKFNLQYAENMRCFEQTIQVNGRNVWFAVHDVPEKAIENVNQEIIKSGSG